jgi:hypothetical protein
MYGCYRFKSGCAYAAVETRYGDWCESLFEETKDSGEDKEHVFMTGTEILQALSAVTEETLNEKGAP